MWIGRRRRARLLPFLVASLLLSLSWVAVDATSAWADTSPNAPQNVDAFSGQTTAFVTWAAPAPNGSSAIQNYVISAWHAADGSQATEISQVTVCGTCLNGTVTGLTPGNSYFFDVFDFNQSGQYSYATSNSTTPGYPSSSGTPFPSDTSPVTTTPTSSFPYATIGILTFTNHVTGQPQQCTGEVITAANQDMVWTAGHCVWTGTGSSGGFNSNFVFYPGAYPSGNGHANPYGAWTSRTAQSTAAWETANDLRADFGVVLLNQSSGRHIQAVVGSLGFLFNYPVGQGGGLDGNSWHDPGYPTSGGYNGSQLVSCDSSYGNSLNPMPGDYGHPPMEGSGCAVNLGMSGSPRIAIFSPNPGSTDYVQSIDSYYFPAFPWETGNIFGPYQGNDAATLYNAMANA